MISRLEGLEGEEKVEQVDVDVDGLLGERLRGAETRNRRRGRGEMMSLLSEKNSLSHPSPFHHYLAGGEVASTAEKVSRIL